ncbi:cell wall binding repeat family protein [Streptococcus mitis]|uniref:Endo-beta-N-acetylglucosaminidase n=1 Tax=Streptococcus mitis TaxID=28037 RepID=A0A1T0C5Y2_STRMT|nr:N-acetylmuramoyl-L-alanine amidase family protein [Streptococcus mitis]OOS17786.1 endo-beta-N-acetylglucosaminidase [Streptococcus mitis]QBZ14068.1 cell wall binding repeat family protein [Streptococcus mitis]
MKKYILLASAVLAVGLATTTSDTNPFFVSTVRADEQTLTTAAKYYIIVPNDSKVFKNWKGTVNRPIISATKTTPELSYFQESDRNYIAYENKSGANYIEWKGSVEEFKEAIKKLSSQTTASSIPKTSNQSTTSQKDGWSGSSYYQNGTKVTSKWIFDKNYNSYFYLDASGNYVQNAWEGDYYLKSGGYMAKKEWIYDKNYGAYYYLTSDGYYARNAWVGNYYLKSNGKMAKNEWIYDNNYKSYYYLTSEGSYARNTWVGDYYLKSNGKMAKGEWIYDSNDSSYYYLTSEGRYARNTWVGDYYLKSNGKMAVNERTPDGYQVDESGKWIRSQGTHTSSSSQATSLGIGLYHVNDAMTYIDIALPSTPSSSYQVAYDFALVDANTGSVSTQTQFTVTYNPSLRAFQTRHFFSDTPDGSYRFVIKGKGQDGKVYDGQSVVFRVKNHRFVG